MSKKDKEGRWIDAKGDPIPIKYVDPVDKKRDKLVMKLICQAEKINEQICKFKVSAIDNIEKYLTEVEQFYNVKVKTKQGNKILTDFSNTVRVEIKIAKHIAFDDRLSLAKSLIDECIKRWSKNADDKIKLLVEDAFKVDKKGNIDKERILSLRKIKIKDQDWLKAMDIISDSVTVIGKRVYIMFYIKNKAGIFESVPLDIARC